jgi:hypothetical protein
MAFEVKAKRMAETELLSIPFDKKKGDFRAWDHYEALLADEDRWKRWKTTSAEFTGSEKERLSRAQKKLAAGARLPRNKTT